MATDSDLPPPLPDSPPPPAGDEEQAEPGRGKFKALQKMLSSSKTMYSSPGVDFSIQAAPPPKKQHVSDTAVEESSTLTHITRDRPKRKVRPPSQKGKGTSSKDTSKEPDSKLEVSVIEEMEYDTLPSDLPPPPPPSSAPPGLPPEPPPIMEEETEGINLKISAMTDYEYVYIFISQFCIFAFQSSTFFLQAQLLLPLILMSTCGFPK